MAMKLLPKSEIDKRKAAEQRIAVEEGVKLARRVDTLREAAAATEFSLKNYRDTTLATINEEIEHKTKEKVELASEVQALQEERAELQKPLDSEWATVRAATLAVNERTEAANVREYKLADREGEIALTEKKVAALLTRATAREDIATRGLADADDAEQAAKLALATAERLKREAIIFKTKTHQELMHRDLMATSRERSVSIKEKDLAAREQTLADGWKLLKDREALFERNLKRK